MTWPHRQHGLGVPAARAVKSKGEVGRGLDLLLLYVGRCYTAICQHPVFEMLRCCPDSRSLTALSSVPTLRDCWKSGQCLLGIVTGGRCVRGIRAE